VRAHKELLEHLEIGLLHGNRNALAVERHRPAPLLILKRSAHAAPPVELLLGQALEHNPLGLEPAVDADFFEGNEHRLLAAVVAAGERDDIALFARVQSPADALPAVEILAAEVVQGYARPLQLIGARDRLAADGVRKKLLEVQHQVENLHLERADAVEVAGEHRVCTALAEQRGEVSAVAHNRLYERQVAEAVKHVGVGTALDQEHPDLKGDFVGHRVGAPVHRRVARDILGVGTRTGIKRQPRDRDVVGTALPANLERAHYCAVQRCDAEHRLSPL
jgi:hypothetical protein